MTPQQTKHGQEHEWAVILAGGDGTRLKPLTRKIAGDERPKQFCRVLGGATLLEETQRRAALEMARERTVYVVNQTHEPYFAPILGAEPAANLVIQPRNSGTAPAILYSLLRIEALDADAIVALLPSIHYISDNRKFMAHVRTAVDTARRQTELVILLGVEPESPEVEYGWIEPTVTSQGHPRIFGRAAVLGEAEFDARSSPAIARLPVEQLRHDCFGACVDRNDRGSSAGPLSRV